MASPTELFDNKNFFGVDAQAAGGTAATIVAADGMRFEEFSLTVNDNPEENNSIRTTFGKSVPFKAGKTVDMAATWRAKGSGTAGTAPAQPGIDLMEAAGFSHTNKTTRDEFLLGDTSTGVTAQQIKGVAAAATGKSVEGRDIKGDWTATMTPGKTCKETFTGPGILESEDDATMLAQTGEDDTSAPPMINGNMFIGTYHATANIEATDGAVEQIADGAASNLKFGLEWTQSGNQTVVGYLVNWQKVGTPANETNGVTISIQEDSGGDPDGSAISNSSISTATSLIDPDASYWHVIPIPWGSRPALVDTTDYHVVVEADYDPDASNCVQLDTNAVAAPAQICQYYDAAWAALGLKNFCIKLIVMDTGGQDLHFGESTLQLNNETSLEAENPSDAQGYSPTKIIGADPTWTVSPLDALDSEVDLKEFYDDEDELCAFVQVGTASGNITEYLMEHGIVHSTEVSDRGGSPVRSLMIHLDREITYAQLLKTVR